MDDKVTIARIAKLHPKLRGEIADILADIHSNGLSIRITQGLRTIAEQDALYAQGRTTAGAIVTQAKGGQSFHNYGLAVDFCLLHSDGSVSFSITEDTNQDKIKDWDNIVASFKKFGWEHGDRGYFDNPHFQKVFGTTPQQLFALVQAGKVDKDGYVIL